MLRKLPSMLSPKAQSLPARARTHWFVATHPPTPAAQYHGCISVNDVLKNLMGELSAKQPHVRTAGLGRGAGIRAA